MKKLESVLWGIVFIAIGVILGLNATGVIGVNIFFEGWWTLFIIIPCLINLITSSDKKGNLIGLLVGVVLLLACQDIFEIEIVWKLLIPAILITIGLSFIFKDTFNHTVSIKIKDLNKKRNGTTEYNAVFSGQTVNFDSEKFAGTDLLAVFGGLEADFKRALIDEDVVINAKSIFGGIEIYVPNNIKVKVKSTSIFGGVSDERRDKQEEKDSKVIYINATCIFGGVEIK